ncbi:hypothetical protein V498_06886 [Pseudogymnoascus sp. VKM F-4517 (FW-2822)]|nr:hypothetical protein V498_06886 [Pseudogymnoascus sp. VKM F-4517 (FW-2822)]
MRAHAPQRRGARVRVAPHSEELLEALLPAGLRVPEARAELVAVRLVVAHEGHDAVLDLHHGGAPRGLGQGALVGGSDVGERGVRGVGAQGAVEEGGGFGDFGDADGGAGRGVVAAARVADGMGLCVYVCVSVFARFGGLVMAMVAVDYLGRDVVMEEAGDDLDADEAEDEEYEEQPGGFCGGHLGFFEVLFGGGQHAVERGEDLGVLVGVGEEETAVLDAEVFPSWNAVENEVNADDTRADDAGWVGC